MRGVFCVTGLLLLASGAPAEVMPLPTDLIVDEFDDPVAFDLPFAPASVFVDQTGIGPLGADRRLDIVDLNVDGIGTYEARDSAIVVDVDSASPACVDCTLGLSFGGRYDLRGSIDLPARAIARNVA